MAICVDCGSPCGLRHKVSLHEEKYVCGKCYYKRQSNAWKIMGGLIFLGFSAAVSGVATALILKPIAVQMGTSFARYFGFGIGVAGIIGYIFTRSASNKISGCIARFFIKILGFISYALGVGMLILTLLLGDTFKEVVSDESKEPDTEQPAAPVAEQPAAPAAEQQQP